MCYGNSAITTDQSNKTAVWDSNYKAVYHMPNGTSLSATDSTSNANNCTPTNSPTATTGQIDGAANFVAASTQYESCGASASLGKLASTTATWSFWMNAAYNSDFMIMGKNDNNSVNAGWWINNFNSNPSNTGSFGVKGVRLNLERGTTNMRVGATAPTSSVWTLVTIVYDGTDTAANQKIYYNGVSQTLTTAKNSAGVRGDDSAQTFYIGRFLGASTPISESGITPTTLNGSIDEIEISNTMRSADWILTQYNNQILPDKTGGATGFYTLGSEGAPAITAPGAPTSVSAVSGDAQATVTFTAPASNGGSTITGYTVTSSPGGIIASGASSPITVTGLTNGTTYTFTVTASNVVGTSTASGASNSVTPVAVPTAPNPPTIGAVTATNTQVTVAFTPPVSDGGSAITSYTVTSSPGGITKTGTSSPLTVTGLTNGTAYTFSVTATNAIGTSSPSASSATATPATIPGAPTIGTATAGDAQASVAFTAPASNGGSAITSYTVTSSPGNFTASGTSSPIVVTGLTNSTSYTFTVTATNVMGTSSASSASNSVRPVSASATVPGSPTITSVLGGNGKALVIFNAPASNGGDTITSYTVTSSPGGFTATASSTAIYVTGLTNGTAYTFRVVATNSVGNSAPSSVSSSTIPFAVSPLNYPIVHVIEENRSLEDVGLPGSSLMPYLSSLITSGGALTDNYYANTHPSIPNYHWMLSGGSGGVTTNDCTSTFTNDNIFRHLISQGITFRFYIESLGNGNTGADWVNCSAGVRATNANWGWGGEYSDIRNQTTAEKNAEFVDMSQLATDIANHTLPQVVFIAPNLENDQHPPASIVTADTWLQTNLAGLIASSYFQPGGTGLLAVNWDEGNWDSGNPSFTDARCSSTVSTGCGGRQATVLYGPRIIKGMTDSTYYQHQSMLRTLMAAAGFTSGFPGAAATATDMSAMFISGSVMTPDLTPPTAAVTYSDADGIVKAGDVITITATFSEPLLDTPVVKIALSGGATLSATNMTKASSTVYTYTYTVGAGDGTVNVTLSAGMDPSSNVVTGTPTSGATFIVDNTAPTNQDTVFATSTSQVGGSALTIVSSGDPTNNVWLAPSGTTNFVASATTTKAVSGTSTSILTPTVTGTYKLYIIDAAGNISSASTATLTVVVATLPGAPTSTSAVAGNAQAIVTFSAPSFDGYSTITGYTVTSSPGNITATGSASPITVTGLTNGTAYTFTVTATNGVGTGSSSAPTTAVTPITVPGAPTSVSATAGNSQATVSFSAPASNGGSAITRYTITSSPGGFTATTSTATPVIVTGLTNGTAYTFTVTATNAAGTSSASSASSAVTPATIPGAPTSISASAGNTQAVVSFTAPVSNGGSAITSYTVTSSPGGFTASGASSPITVTGLTNGTSYTFSVTATNIMGTSTVSTSSNAVTPVSVPGSPTSVSATGGNSQATVTFSAPASNGGSTITGYVVTSSPGNITATGTSSPITVTGLTNGTSYTFTVAAINGNGTGTASASSNSVTLATVPTAPTIGTATAGNGQVIVTFTPGSNGGSAITGYSVTSSPGGITATGSSSPIIVTGLTNGTAYTFSVTATNAVGTSSASSASNAATPSSVPGAPTISGTTPGNGQVTVAFSAPASDGGSTITGYTVTSSPGNITATGSASPITVTGLTNGTGYTFTVAAINANGTSSASTASSVTTPTVPAVPVATVTYSDSDGIVKAGDVVTITADFSEPLQDSPVVKIALSGANTVAATNMTKVTTTRYTYTHTVGSGDGTVTVAFSVGLDSDGNEVTSAPVSGATFTVDNTAPTNQDTVFATTATTTAGASVTIVSSGNTANNVWFAPSGTTNFVASATTTKATNGLSTTILAPSTNGTYVLYVVDAAGNISSASAATLTVVDPTIQISNISAGSIGSTGATITWNTNVNGSSKVDYGLTSVYDLIIAETDTSPRVQSHTVSLTGLNACTTYHYKVTSTDASSNTVASSDTVFTTTGCTSAATVSTSTDVTIGSGSGGGGSLIFSATTLNVPASFTSTSSSVVFQAKELNPVTFFAGVGVPTGESRVGSYVVNLSAFNEDGSTLSTFELPLTLTLSYSPSDVSGITESSLKIYRYDVGTGWTALSSCVVDTTAHTVTCQTSNFSDFSLFGTAASIGGGGSSPAPTGGGGGSGGSFSVVMPYPTTNATTSAIDDINATSTGKLKIVLNKPFKLGSKDPQIKLIQQFLNKNGFMLAKSGVGSPGHETTQFGPLMKKAIQNFQFAYKIVKTKYDPGFGTIGPGTRAKLQVLMNK